MLSAWISSGVLKDSFSEFMVEETQSSSGADSAVPESDYWRKHFVLRRRRDEGGGDVNDVPVLLESVSDAVLQAGMHHSR